MQWYPCEHHGMSNFTIFLPWQSRLSKILNFLPDKIPVFQIRKRELGKTGIFKFFERFLMDYKVLFYIIFVLIYALANILMTGLLEIQKLWTASGHVFKMNFF